MGSETGSEENMGRGKERRGQTEGFHFLMTSFRGTRSLPLGTYLSAEADALIIKWGGDVLCILCTPGQGVKQPK